MALLGLMPPLLPAPPPQFQTVSEIGLVAVNVVPPTCTIFVLLDGSFTRVGSSTALFTKASESPEALKNVCPCAAICLKICSIVGLGPPLQPHDELIWLAALSVAMRFKTSSGKKLVGFPS